MSNHQLHERTNAHLGTPRAAGTTNPVHIYL